MEVNIKRLFVASAAILAMGAFAGGASGQQASAPITKGQKIVMATHSFNVFIGPGRGALTGPGCAAPPNPNAGAVAAGGAAGQAAGRGGAGAGRGGAAAAGGRGAGLQAAQGGGRAGAAPAGSAAVAAGAPSVPLLTRLTNERGITGQEFLAVQMIGGSTPMQHWNQGGQDACNNIAKAALASAGDRVDVFTMSPNAIMPEPGIDNFGDFVIRNNKNARIMVQNSWGAYDGHGSTPSVGGTGGGNFTNADRDKATLEEVAAWNSNAQAPGGYLERLRTQLTGINTRAGRQIAYVVPSGQAVNTLRVLVLQGRVPGLTKSSEMYRDPIGHPTTPTSNLVAYVWFTAMYRQSPVGLQALVDKSDPNSAAREKVLQQVAWNTVIAEPMSGVKGTPVRIGS